MDCHPTHRAQTSAWFALLTLILVSGCAEMEEFAPDGAEHNAPRVIGGVNEDGEPATVSIEMHARNGDILLCSGTVIAPRVVLTAAHCVAKLSPDGMNINGGIAQHVSIFNGDREVHRSDVEDGAFHREWNDSNLHAGVDIGLLYVRQPLPVQPVPLDQAPADSRTGEVGKIVGFGVNETGNAGEKCRPPCELNRASAISSIEESGR